MRLSRTMMAFVRHVTAAIVECNEFSFTLYVPVECGMLTHARYVKPVYCDLYIDHGSFMYKVPSTRLGSASGSSLPPNRATTAATLGGPGRTRW